MKKKKNKIKNAQYVYIHMAVVELLRYTFVITGVREMTMYSAKKLN